ncbi:aminomethyl-transferring glycine dehydrogenase [Neomegalonema perideroedes]|uniref:aminomethyl-transferring glycine dehydrogenase n=1 Tax=Neomegalonema perideroedes TaxID=217219 RepID=UPI0003601788|nr:aminomethyl-transferring glycine dehydrogenase [Neomegalonema perideroedes]
MTEQNAFARRHNGPDASETAAMLKVVGAPSLDALMAETVPASIRVKTPLNLPAALTEHEALDEIRALAARNKPMISLIGQGYHGTLTPPVLLRNVFENPAWYTSYTPYQPEISQGRLEALLNFQTMIGELTGLEIANASLLDEATAAAEAMALAKRGAKSKANAFFVDSDVHPQTLAVIRTRAEPLGWEVLVGDPLKDLDAAKVFGALIQYPGSSGALRDPRPAVEALHKAGAFAIFAADPLALVLLTSPGDLGADAAVGSTQRFGVPMGWGGPHAAYMATRDAHKRIIPGRIVGLSVDSRGAPALRLALQTREQHIRREKATSNVCTAQALLAIMAGLYAAWHGPEGLTAIARRTHALTLRLAEGLKALGFAPEADAFFDTLTVQAGDQAAQILAAARAEGINLRDSGGGRIGINLDETTTPAVVEAVWRAFGGSEAFGAAPKASAIPEALRRQDAPLKHPVFSRYRSETEMMRYLRKLADRDLALDRTMIPLGSCTMKLNAAAEMTPVSWPAFANMHPYAPADQAEGYRALVDQLSAALCEITGYDAVSMQPNSGAQGEYAGLLAIRGYHASRGDAHRKICLIPASAHGTNPASAQMVGYEVVVVSSTPEGEVDMADLAAKAEKHAAALAAIMITYPSTHGVFEENIRQICDIVHQHGGQVYLDGANMNAQVGLSRPGDYGSDVSHLNLHKTFCIPHGGGGPGMGPIGVKAHLTPFLPGDPATGQGGAVSAAACGSPSILPISWMYCRMMGPDGLTEATKLAILNANYIAARLAPHFPVLYSGAKGRVAHECILDPRGLKETAGVTVDDIAKRLMDFGFHAPTMSFPVAGALMVEPTESEAKSELDRFCAAMIAIREEIRAVEDGRLPKGDNPLSHAPHSAADLQEGWNRAYSIAQGFFPAGVSPQDKYWPPVNRVDNAHGDRNLICSCPPLEDYAQAAE